MAAKRSLKRIIGMTLLKLVVMICLVSGALYVPGQSTLQIQNYLITLPSGTLVAILIAIFIVLHFLLKGFSWLKHLPDHFNRMLHDNRQQKAQRFMMESYTALAAGEHSTAVELAEKAHKFDKSQNLIQVIMAQALFSEGQLKASEEIFLSLTKSDKTRFLGLRGLVLLRQKQQRFLEIPSLLQKALIARPTSNWALQQLFEVNVRNGEFEKAEVVIEQLQLTGGMSKPQAKRSKALLLWVKAEAALKNTDYNTFFEACNEAIKLAPDLIVAATTLARYYQESNRHSKAWKTLLQAYQTNPHPSFLDSLKVVFQNTSSLELYQQGEELVREHMHHPASLIILSHLAIEAKLWGQARLHLNLLGQKQPTQTYYRLMGLLEQSEYPNKKNKAEDYYYESSNAPYDPAWICHSCHTVAHTWSAFCTKCQGFDTLQWQSRELSTTLQAKQIN